MTSIEDLAERLLTYPYSPTGLPQVARILPDEIPSGLPLDPPTPPGAVLLGSLVRTSDQQLASAEVILDAPGDAEEIAAFYEQTFLANGWTAAPVMTPMRGGFTPAAGPSASRSFCRGASGPWLSVTLRPLNGGLFEVRLHIDLVMPGPCAGGGPAGFPPGMHLLPSLSAPPGEPLQPGGGGGGPDAWWSEATARTDRRPAELEIHFAGQFSASGWTRVAGGADGPLAWSTWRRTEDDREWQGVLFVLETSSQQRLCYARVALAGSGGGGWAAQSYTSIRPLS